MLRTHPQADEGMHKGTSKSSLIFCRERINVQSISPFVAERDSKEGKRKSQTQNIKERKFAARK